MAEFVCKVGDPAGRTFEHVESAQTETEARQKLADRGWYVFSIRTQLDLLGRLGKPRGAVRLQDFLIFNQQFNTLIKAGLPILKALDLLAERAAAPRLRPLLADVRQRVRDGALLSEALAAQGSFPPVYVTAIAAGERSGNLTGVLEQYISYLRVSTGFRRSLLTALIYPSILVCAVILVLSYLVTFALPRFAELYKDLGVALPTPTRILMDVALPARNYFLLFVALIIGAAFAVYVWTRAEAGAIAVDRIKPHVPLFGEIWLKSQIAQFKRTLATLLAGGTPLVAAMETAGRAINSRLLAKAISGAAARVREGSSLHASLAETRLVPDLALEMIEVGEASGALTAMLMSVAEFYEEEVQTRLQRALVWISPAVLVLMAIVIGFILIALYLPMFSLQIGSTGG